METTIQTDKTFRILASKIEYIKRLEKENNEQFYTFLDKAKDKIEFIERNILPHGSGIDSGCKIDLTASNENKIVITFGFHHMDENGYYDGWTEHKLIIKPSLVNDFDLRITGKDRNFIKDYLYELFDYALRQQIERY